VALKMRNMAVKEKVAIGDRYWFTWKALYY
jgi:hypothetical protein